VNGVDSARYVDLPVVNNCGNCDRLICHQPAICAALAPLIAATFVRWPDQNEEAA
jgi:hypothetical protein